MTSSKKFFIPVLLFLISFYLRGSLISKGPYHADCLRLAITAEQILTQKKLLFLQASGLPLTALMGAGFVGVFKLFQNKDIVFAVNFMSVLMSSLSVVFFYLFVKVFFDRKTAALSALLLLVNPIFLATSVYGNSHMPALFFMLPMFLLLKKATQEDKLRSYLLPGIFLGLMGAARLQDAVFAGIPALYFLFCEKKKGEEGSFFLSRLKKIGIFLISAISVTVAFYLPGIFLEGESVGRHWLFKVVEAQVLKGIALKAFVFKANAKHFLDSLTVAGFLLCLIGGVVLKNKNSKRFWFLFLWIFPGLLFFGSLIYTRPRLFLIPVLGCVLLQGIALSSLSKNRYEKILSLGLFFMVISLSLASVLGILNLRNQQAYLPEFYQWVAAKTEPNALIIERDNSLFIKFYAKRECMSLTRDLYVFKNKDRERFKQKLDEELRSGRPVYATGSGLAGYNPSFKNEEYMQREYKLTFVGHYIAENWQPGALVSRIGLIPLYKIELKNK